MDEDTRQTLIARSQRSRTALDSYVAELDLLHYDMQHSKVWNNQLTREFMLRHIEVEQTYAESQKTKARWT